MRKKADIFQYDKVLVPLNVGKKHWCLAVIHMDEKRLDYYDSCGSDNAMCLQALVSYFQDEAQTNNHPFTPQEWTTCFPKNIPRQYNEVDCGVFILMYAEYVARGAQFDFTEADMPAFRRKITLDILNGSGILNGGKSDDSDDSDDNLPLLELEKKHKAKPRARKQSSKATRTRRRGRKKQKL